MHNCTELEYLDLSKNKRISGQVPLSCMYGYFLKVYSDQSTFLKFYTTVFLCGWRLASYSFAIRIIGDWRWPDFTDSALQSAEVFGCESVWSAEWWVDT